MKNLLKKSKFFSISITFMIVTFMIMAFIISSIMISASEPTSIAKTPLNQTIPEQVIIPVLTYHRIIAKTTSVYDFTPQMLERHFKFFQSLGYQPISAAQLIAYKQQPALFPKKPIVLTFDDGNKSHYTKVFPLLKKYGFQATFFVYPRAIKDASSVCLTWAELQEMANAGFDIECHSMSHPFLTQSKVAAGDNSAYLKWLDNELLCSRALLEYKLARRVTLLAYPYGWFDNTVESSAIKAGYQGIFTVNWGQNLPSDNNFRLKRRVMDNTMNLDQIKQYITAKPLSIEIISPVDAAAIAKIPVIRFKIGDPDIKSVTLSIRNYKAVLRPDKQGIYTFSGINKLKPGYCMAIIRGYGNQKAAYMGSWGFNYQVPAVAGIIKPLQKVIGNRKITPVPHKP